MIESASLYLRNLESILENDFSATGDNLSEKLASIRLKLPDDLAAGIEELIAGSRSSPAEADWAALIFRCGQLSQRLEGLRQAWAAENVVSAHPAGIAPEELESTDLDAIARFIAARDRVMRVIADFTLKALLIILGLLIAGLALGII